MNETKKILYLITQSELGGAQRYVFDLAKNLQNEFNITVAFGEQGEKGELVRQLQRANIKYYALPHLKRAICPLNDFLAFIEIIKLIKKIKPDIIHLNSSKISILGSIATKMCFMFHITCYVIYTVHGWVFNEPLPKWKKFFYKYAEKFTASFKNKIICVSEFDRQIAIQQKIAPEKKLITIHNGIKPVDFLPKQEALQKLMPNTYNLKPNTQIIGTIGNFYKTKGFKYLIKATKLLIDKGLKIKIIIIGEGEERKNLEKLIKQNNLSNNFILTGKINNAAQLLPAFDIYVCSSVKEGLSYTIIEAMQAGLPIVATKVGGNPELIEDNKTGLLVEAKNPQMLAEKINRLTNNPKLSQELGEQAKIKAEEEFNLERMVKKTKEIYNIK